MTSRRESFRFARCRRCNLVYLNPRVAEEDIGLFYGDDYPPHRGPDAWGRFAPLVRLGQHHLDLERVRITARVAELTHRSRVLDVGCGRPSFLLQLHQTRHTHCVGIDVSDEGWRSAPAEFRPLTLHRGTIHDVKLKPTFDVVTMWHSIEHEADPVSALRRLRALATDSTTLVIETPNFDSLTRRAHGSWWAGFHTPRHMAVYAPSTLTRLLETTGWRLSHLQTWATLDAYLLWWLGRKDRQGRLQGGNLEGLFLPFVAGKIASWPVRWMERAVSLGLMLAFARPG
jgi:2-polyprenyl-3-methyl-5-hydroxy-6-metoxy-1,4-benzoquinol methylase